MAASSGFVGSASLAALLAAASVQAAPIAWNTWSSPSSGSFTLGAATVDVTFTGTPTDHLGGYPSYGPAATWADGVVVDNGPVAANGIVRLEGGSATVQTLTFSVPVVDPVIAFWSLGDVSTRVEFVFDGFAPVFVSGGPNDEYGGSSIVVAGNTVSGMEGNGTVQFLGTYSSIFWTNPTHEFWYGFNVGAPVPDPGTMALWLAGLAGLGAFGRRRGELRIQRLR